MGIAGMVDDPKRLRDPGSGSTGARTSFLR